MRTYSESHFKVFHNKLGVVDMYQTMLENIYNKELFLQSDKSVSKIVDGIEYIEVTRISNQKAAMMRKDSLKVVQRKDRLK